MNEIIFPEEHLLDPARSKLHTLLSDPVINIAKQRIMKYNETTDSILFSEGLISIREMISDLERVRETCNVAQTNFLIEELFTRMREIDNVCKKIRRKRSIKNLSVEDAILIHQIDRYMVSLLGKSNNSLLLNLHPFLLECSKEVRK